MKCKLNVTVDPGLTALGSLQRRCSPPAVRRRRFFQIIFGLVLFWGVFTCRAADVTVFAAASLVESLKEIATNYEQQTTQTVVFNFAGSSTLARQIEEGAPADVFFSADEAQMNRLEQKGLLLAGTRRDLLSNTLVVVVAAEHGMKVRSPRDLIRPDIHRIALGDPLSVPIGVYAREYLQKAGLWDRVAPKVVPTENVRGALAAVESGNADASIVYLTDARTSSKVSIAYRVPAEDSPKIRYPVALVRTARQPASHEFLEFLASNPSGKAFENRGFIVIR